MTLERNRRDYPAKARTRGWGTWVPGWYLRLRLDWAVAGITRLERQLADEFATVDTSPLHRELEALMAEREALINRLLERA